MVDLIDLINSYIIWKKHPENIKYFYTKFNDKVILLRLNNFPDEPLFTIIDGFLISDIEDRPNNWEFEKSDTYSWPG